MTLIEWDSALRLGMQTMTWAWELNELTVRRRNSDLFSNAEVPQSFRTTNRSGLQKDTAWWSGTTSK